MKKELKKRGILHLVSEGFTSKTAHQDIPVAAALLAPLAETAPNLLTPLLFITLCLENQLALLVVLCQRHPSLYLEKVEQHMIV